MIEIEALTYLCTLPTEHRAGFSGSSSLFTSECWDPGASGSGGGALEPKAFSETSELEDPEPVMSTLELESDVDDSESEDPAPVSHEVSELEDIRLGSSASMADDRFCGLQFVIFVCQNIVQICELIESMCEQP